jgi:tRNA nucleotidyltransferase/poly(A) polymerase
MLSDLCDEDRIVLDRLREEGEAWIVGGWVRDVISGLMPTDIDIATNLRPDEVKMIFPRSIMVGEKFGTVIVRFDGTEHKKYQCEVTTLREDGGYADGRRPENVTFGNEIGKDLDRRDFTINSMAIEPIGPLSGENESFGKLINHHRGEEDLSAGILRAVGDAEKRLGEDGLRVIRAFRFLEQGDGGLRKLDTNLSNAISSNLGMLEKVSKERIWGEMQRILSGQNSREIVDKMETHGVMKMVLPGISLNREVVHSNDYLVNLALMCSSESSSGSELWGAMSENLKLSRKEGAILSLLHEYRDIELDSSTSSVRRFMATLSEPHRGRVLEYLNGLGLETMNFQDSCNRAGELKAGNAPLVDGNLLSNLTGLEPGRRLGRLKGWLHRIQVEQDIENREALISKLSEIDWEHSDYEEWPILSWP